MIYSHGGAELEVEIHGVTVKVGKCTKFFTLWLTPTEGRIPFTPC